MRCEKNSMYSVQSKEWQTMGERNRDQNAPLPLGLVPGWEHCANCANPIGGTDEVVWRSGFTMVPMPWECDSLSEKLQVGHSGVHLCYWSGELAEGIQELIEFN